MRTSMDTQDQELIAQRVALLDEQEGARVGDFVRFADGIERRISYLWPDGAQTSDGGSYYLGNGYLSMSGSLYPCVPIDSLAPTSEQQEGSAWIFHHDWHTAGGGVDTMVSLRVFDCDRPAPH